MTLAAWRRIVERIAAREGARVVSTSGGHLKIVHPSGWYVFTSGTPGDWRVERNTESQIRRAKRGAKP